MIQDCKPGRLESAFITIKLTTARLMPAVERYSGNAQFVLNFLAHFRMDSNVLSDKFSQLVLKSLSHLVPTPANLGEDSTMHSTTLVWQTSSRIATSSICSHRAHRSSTDCLMEQRLLCHPALKSSTCLFLSVSQSTSALPSP